MKWKVLLIKKELVITDKDIIPFLFLYIANFLINKNVLESIV
jgi:hypothetical protein